MLIFLLAILTLSPQQGVRTNKKGGVTLPPFPEEKQTPKASPERKDSGATASKHSAETEAPPVDYSRSLYEKVRPRKPPRKIRRTPVNFEIGFHYEATRLRSDSFQGFNFDFATIFAKKYGFSYQLGMMWHNDNGRYDMRYGVGFFYNFYDGQFLKMHLKTGYSFDLITMPADYITSLKEQMQHGYFFTLGLRYQLVGPLFLYSSVDFLHYFTVEDTQQKGVVGNQRGYSFRAGITFRFPPK